MGTIHKIGDTYYIEFEARGLKYQQKAGDDEVKARELLAATEEKIRRGEMSAVVRDVPIEIFVKDFAEFSVKNYPPRTDSRLQAALKHFTDFLARQYPNLFLLSVVTPKIIEEYKFFYARGGSKPWRINFTLLLLREIFEYAIKMGYLNDNPTLHIRCVQDKRKVPLWVTNDRLTLEVLEKGISLFILAKLLKTKDILKVMPFYTFLRQPV